MASSGADSWQKYFKDKGVVDTVMKNDSTLYDEKGAVIGKIKTNDPIKVLVSDTYEARYPIQIATGKRGFVTFSNISKPKTTRATAGIKLKPQDFKTIMSGTSFKYKTLASDLIDELEDRTDLDPRLVNYTVALTKHWAGIDGVSAVTVSSLYDSQIPGLAELQKDYGEMLGAIACINKNLLKDVGSPLTVNASIKFPLIGNEPIVDYYILPGAAMPPISISAKSGDTTNTLKPQHILQLLETNNKTSFWRSKPIYKIMQLVNDKSIPQLPFYAINMLMPLTLSATALREVDIKFKAANFQTTNYDKKLFTDVFKLLGFEDKNPPKVGELFYAAEAFVCKKLNELYPEENKKIFKDATSALVIYVKFKITPAKSYGQFDIMASDANSVDSKEIKWRPKNSKNRAGDKIGLQP